MLAAPEHNVANVIPLPLFRLGDDKLNTGHLHGSVLEPAGKKKRVTCERGHIFLWNKAGHAL